jgi:hypothetical protein
MSNLKYSGIFPVYKKKAAAQFSIIKIKTDDSGKIQKEGSILLEVAPAIEGKSKAYDWSKKISFAISRADIVTLMENPKAPPRIMHVPPSDSGTTKALEFVPGEGAYAGTYMMKIGENNKAAGTNKYYTVPLSAGEYYCMQSLMLGSLRYLIGWQF